MEGCIPIFYADALDEVQNQSLYVYQPQTVLSKFNLTMLVQDREISVDNYELIELILYKYVVPSIAAIGIVGNILNLIILTKKSLQKSMDRY